MLDVRCSFFLLPMKIILLTPGTALSVGFTDGYDNVTLESAAVRPTQNPTTSTGRLCSCRLRRAPPMRSAPL